MPCLIIAIYTLMSQANKNTSMLKRLFPILFLAAFLLPAQAQKPRNKCEFSPDEFHARLEQFITRAACLTPKEASKFFPVYKEMFQKQRALYDEMRNYKRIKPVGEAECKRCVEKMDKIDIEIKQIQRRYHDKFLQILPAGKVYDVIKAEDKFYRQAFKRAADRSRKERKNN